MFMKRYNYSRICQRYNYSHICQPIMQYIYIYIYSKYERKRMDSWSIGLRISQLVCVICDTNICLSTARMNYILKCYDYFMQC